MTKTKNLLEQIKLLEQKLSEKDDELRHIQEGNVDAVVVKGVKGEQLYSLENTTVRTILEGISDGFLAFDRKWNFTYLNHEGARTLGRPLNELLGKNLWKEFPELKKTSFGKLYRKAMRNQKVAVYEDFYEPFNAWFSVRVYPSKYGLSLYFHDITERKKMEINLLESRKRESMMIQATKLGIWYCDLPFDELIWDEKVKEHFFLPPKSRVTIETFYDRLHPEDRERTRQAINESINNHTSYDIEYRTVHPKDKTKFKWIRAIGRTFYDTNDKPIRFDGVTLDISEQKTLEQQKDEFISIASHELKTPVTSLKAYTQVLQAILEKKGDERSVKHLGKMDSQLNKLTDLIGDLLDVTKIEAGKLQFNVKFFNFDDLVDETVETMQLTTGKHTLIQKGKTWKKVYGDKDRIGQVLTNLISNAIKYSPHSKKIIIKSTYKNDSVTVSVQDFGVGIPKNKQENVFERFFRVSGPNTQTFPGLGLGLYISNEIIKRLGGRIWVESIKGKGSTFYFSLPIGKRKIIQADNNLGITV